MSIPGFYRPVTLRNNDGDTSYIVDGGLLSNFPIQLFVMMIVKQHGEPLQRPDAKMVATMHTHLELVYQFALVEMRAALIAANKDVLGAHHAFGGRHGLDLLLFFAKPGHC